MTHISLTSDQDALLSSATDPVYITNSRGNVIAKIDYPKLSPEEAAIVEESLRRRDSDQPRIPSDVVLQNLRKLDEQSE